MEDLLRQSLNEAAAPGAVALIGRGDETLFHGASGYRQVEPERRPAERDTLYDLASLTKVIATTTAIMMLRDDGLIDLDQPVYEVIPIPAFGQFTFRHCLTHTTGLVAGLAYYKQCSSINEMLQHYAERALPWAPGTRRRYSDVGFMILGRAVELLGRDRLDAFCRRRIFEPLGMAHTGFNPPAAWTENVAATEQCAWRGAVVAGAVHDENAAAVGGVSGHAGLFSTADDIARFCRAVIEEKVLPGKTLDEMTRMGQVATYPWQGLGWLLDPWACSVNGFLPSRAAMGHTGWTGTSLWIDRASGIFAILLGNTCHPSRDHRNNRAFRQTFYTGVAERLYPDRTNTHTGLDRVVYEGFDAIEGKRLGVLTHHAAVDELGRSAQETLALSTDSAIRLIYSPEHGLKGLAEAGEHVSSTGGQVPVISLYGDRRHPTPEELKQIDLFVIDLQDVGSRYYTYAATMRECLAACARARKPVLVLDRPNPVGGAILEGPIARDTGYDVCCAPIPVRHGMTFGELANFFAKQPGVREAKLQLQVSLLDGWTPSRLFGECSLPWMPPSPNIPTPETALVYVGMCLFEGTNLNEGRGTETPFHVIGAPWLDPEKVIAAVLPEEHAGCRLEPIKYTPQSIPGKASNPRYCDEVCQGIRLHVDEPQEMRPFTVALALLSAVRRTHGDAFAWRDFFDVLAGSSGPREALEQGRPVLEMVKGYEAGLRKFDAQRPKLYV